MIIISGLLLVIGIALLIFDFKLLSLVFLVAVFVSTIGVSLARFINAKINNNKRL